MPSYCGPLPRFLAGLGKLPQPVKGPAAEGVFQSLDSNQDLLVLGFEFRVSDRNIRRTPKRDPYTLT